MARLVIVSNRIVLPGERAARAGGLAVALRDALRRRGGVWFGWSGETGEEPGPAAVTQSGRISFVTMDLKPEDYEAFYGGYSNRVLWPLFHYRTAMVEYQRAFFDGYVRVNRQFAQYLQPLLKPDDIVWVQDYHLMMLAAELRRLGVRNRIGFFLHIPFPAAEVYKVVPEHAQLMEALCQYDLIGLQTRADVRQFCDYIRHETDGRVRDDQRIDAFGRTLQIGAFPVSIDVQGFARMAEENESGPERQRLAESLQKRALILGVDRLDYSKGLDRRFAAYEHFLATHPEHRNKVVFMQIAPPSRTDVKQYRTIRRELEAMAGRINGRYAEYDWVPVRYINKSFTRAALTAFYRLSRACLVTPLRDGMNLVAKEYVAAQSPADPGVLVLSQFAGVAQDMPGSLLVNPIDVDAVAAATHRALTMPLGERQERWRMAMQYLEHATITDWQERFLDALQSTQFDRLHKQVASNVA